MKIKKMVGFSPNYTLEEGLLKTIEWMKKPENLKNIKQIFIMCKRAVILAGGLGTRLRPYTVVLLNRLCRLVNTPYWK